MQYQAGYFLDKIPYVKFGRGENRVVHLQPTQDLFWSVKNFPKPRAKLYSSLGFEKQENYILGYDPNWPSDYTFEEAISDFDSILKNELGPSTLVGISFGGFLAVPLAVRNSDLVRKMILLVSAHRASESGFKKAQEAIELAKKNDRYELLKLMALLFRRRWMNRFASWQVKRIAKNPGKMNSLKVLENAYEKLIEYGDQNRDLCPKIQAETLIIGADQDQFFSKEVYEEVANLIPNSELKLFQNETHMVPLERKREVRKAVKEFLEK